jgi:hypothetical protein
VDLAEATASELRLDGHNVWVASNARFPIADALSHQLSSAAFTQDAVFIILREDQGRELWVEKEMATQAAMTPACRFVLVGGKAIAPGSRVSIAARGDTEALRDFLRHT